MRDIRSQLCFKAHARAAFVLRRSCVVLREGDGILDDLVQARGGAWRAWTRLVARALPDALDDLRAVVEVVDTGVGMERAVQEKLFRPFFTTKGERGTGLGLATCYAIVRRHGGEIEVESAPGEGTTFTVSLPVGDLPA